MPIFSRFNGVEANGDWTLPGAIKDGTECESMRKPPFMSITAATVMIFMKHLARAQQSPRSARAPSDRHAAWAACICGHLADGALRHPTESASSFLIYPRRQVGYRSKITKLCLPTAAACNLSRSLASSGGLANRRGAAGQSNSTAAAR
jgi:hypothetical protein